MSLSPPPSSYIPTPSLTAPQPSNKQQAKATSNKQKQQAAATTCNNHQTIGLCVFIRRGSLTGRVFLQAAESMTATKRLAKAAAALVIVFMTVNNLLLHDESNNNLRRQQNSTDVMTTASILAGEEESLDQFTLRVLNRRDKQRRKDDSRLEGINQQNSHTNDRIICGRPADLGTSTPKESDCPGLNSNTILLLEGTQTYGRTGNALIEFLHSLQYARDNDIKLGVRYGSWAMRLLNRMWLAVANDDQTEWEAAFQNSFCVRIIHSNQELKEWTNVIRMDRFAAL